jgi:hypothetical protein
VLAYIQALGRCSVKHKRTVAAIRNASYKFTLERLNRDIILASTDITDRTSRTQLVASGQAAWFVDEMDENGAAI